MAVELRDRAGQRELAREARFQMVGGGLGPGSATPASGGREQASTLRHVSFLVAMAALLGIAAVSAALGFELDTSGPTAAGEGGPAIIAAPSGVSLADRVLRSDGSPATGVGVDLYTTGRSGERADLVASTTTDVLGRYRFDVGPGIVAPGPDGCVTLVFVASPGAAAVGTGRSGEATVCPYEPGATLPAVRVLDPADRQRLRAPGTGG